MKRTIFIAMIFIIAGALNGQEIRVVDRTDLSPIEHVTIYLTGRADQAITGRSGLAYFSGLRASDTLLFQHTSYIPMVLSYYELESSGFLVKMAERSVKLEEIVISANKWEQNRQEVPNKIMAISEKEIAFENPQTAADMLGQSGEIFIQKSQQGGGSPMIRGFSANSLLIVLDGVRMNNAIYRSGNLHNVNTIDPGSVANAEVIFGPGSVIYGSDAMGGVMDFHTKSPVLSTSGETAVSAGWLGRYSSSNNERTGHIDINIGTKKWGFYTSLTGSFFDDLKMGNVRHEDYRRMGYAARIDGQDVMLANPNPNRQVYTGYDQFNLMQKVLYRPGEKAELQYGFYYATTSDMPRYDRLIQYNDDGTQRYANWYYGPQNWMMHQLSARLFEPVRAFSDARITLAWQDYEESRHSRRFGKDNLQHQAEKVSVLSLNADFEKDLSERDFLFYGLEGIYNKVVSTAEEEDIITGDAVPSGPRYPDGKNNYSTLAGYVNYKRNLRKKATFVAGARYSYIDLYSTIEDTSFYQFPFDEIVLKTGALNGSLGMTFYPGNGYQYNFNLSSGFRAPNLDDVGKVFESAPGMVVVPNPDLKPEYSYNLDLTFIKAFSDRARLELNAFGTLLNDAMVRGDFTFDGQDSIYYMGEKSRVQAVVNADGAYIYGGSFLFEAALTDIFSFRTTLSYVYGEDDAGNSIRHAPPVFGSSNLIMKLDKFRGEIFAVYNGQVPYSRLTPSEVSKDYMYAEDDNGNPYSPRWWTLNLKTSYQLTEHFSADLGIENLLNHRYRPYSSGVVSPGRNIYVTLRGRI